MKHTDLHSVESCISTRALDHAFHHVDRGVHVVGGLDVQGLFHVVMAGRDLALEIINIAHHVALRRPRLRAWLAHNVFAIDIGVHAVFAQLCAKLRVRPITLVSALSNRVDTIPL